MFEELILDPSVVQTTANQKIFLETVTDEPIDLGQIHNHTYLQSLVHATIQRTLEPSNVSPR
jgi:hypothetical protein